MRVLITGATGFVGRPLMRYLFTQGIEGFVVSRSPIQEVPPKWAWVSRTECFESKRSFKVDAVVHLEVKQHVQMPNQSDLLEFERVNVGNTEQWLEWASVHNVTRFVFFSSIKAAGDSSNIQNEESNSVPNTLYGDSKLKAEKKVWTWVNCDSNRTGVILRPAVIYGPGNQANILSLIDAIFKGRFFLIGKNDNIKSMISLNNLLAAVAHLLALPLQRTELFYLTDKESFSVAQISGMISQILHKEPVRTLPILLANAVARFGDLFVKLSRRDFPLTSPRLNALMENTHFSSGKLQNAGFVHPQTTREGLEEMVSWYLTSRGLLQS